MRQQSGFTFVELLIVLIIIGVVAAFGIPRLRDALQKQNVRSARTAATVMVAKARAAAVGRGCVTSFEARSDGRVWVTSCRTDNTAGLDTLGGIEDLAGRFNVSVTPSQNTLRFDPRGLASGGTMTIRFTWSGITDSLFINQVGKVVRL